MILVDIQSPFLDQVYDFELDEEMGVGELVKKAAEILAAKEKIEYDPEDQLYLYAVRSGKLLKEADSLKSQGVRSGERLVLL